MLKRPKFLLPTRGLDSRGKTGFAAPAPPPTLAPWGSHGTLGALESVGDVLVRMCSDLRSGARRVATGRPARDAARTGPTRDTCVATTGDNGERGASASAPATYDACIKHNKTNTNTRKVVYPALALSIGIKYSR
jgi:hypothetical protein